MTKLREDIPKGKTRVIGVDLFDHEDYLVKDCDTSDEAFSIADEKNAERTGSMDDVYYVYNDVGDQIRSYTAVREKTGGLGISP